MPELQATADLMSPLNLFLQADAVVKAVMFGLLLASIWTWAIIFTHSIRLRRINRGTDRFERDFWATNDIDAFHNQRAAQEAGEGVYAVAEVAIRYFRPAKLGDDLLVLSTVEQVRAASVLIHQRVMRGTEQLTDARVTAAFLDPGNRPKRQPRQWVEKFKAISEG